MSSETFRNKFAEAENRAISLPLSSPEGQAEFVQWWGSLVSDAEDAITREALDEETLLYISSVVSRVEILVTAFLDLDQDFTKYQKSLRKEVATLVRGIKAEIHLSSKESDTSGGTRSETDHPEAICNPKGSHEDSSLFETALVFVNDNKSKHEDPVDEDDVTGAHQKAYGDTSTLTANALGGAAALQVLKKLTSGSAGSSDSGGTSQTQLINLAMAEATKLFDKSGGCASGNKQDAINGAAMTVTQLLVQSKLIGGTTGASKSGGPSGLLGMASKFV